MCRVIGRSKLTKTHIFERLSKSLKGFENIESIKLSTKSSKKIELKTVRSESP